MKLAVLKLKYITREYVRANKDKLFLFGDNLEQRGFGGQAAAMRGEPNTVGIPTKKKPTLSADAFFLDSEFASNKGSIDAAFARLNKALQTGYKAVVIPAYGLGAGRAQLDKLAPKTFAYLQQKLSELEALFI